MLRSFAGALRTSGYSITQLAVEDLVLVEIPVESVALPCSDQCAGITRDNVRMATINPDG